jgi:hypothetical protein
MLFTAMLGLPSAMPCLMTQYLSPKKENSHEKPNISNISQDFFWKCCQSYLSRTLCIGTRHRIAWAHPDPFEVTRPVLVVKTRSKQSWNPQQFTALMSRDPKNFSSWFLSEQLTQLTKKLIFISPPRLAELKAKGSSRQPSFFKVDPK